MYHIDVSNAGYNNAFWDNSYRDDWNVFSPVGFIHMHFRKQQYVHGRSKGTLAILSYINGTFGDINVSIDWSV